jgi:hypothetical protein
VTEEILRILLADLATVRIKCAQCDVVTEMSADRLGNRYTGFPKKCPHCSQEFSVEFLRDLAGLAECITELSKPDMVRQAAIEFVSKTTK